MQPSLLYHQWILFRDARGDGRCEPEAFVVGEREVLLYEVKLTGCRYGYEQLVGLYAPLLAHVYSLPVRSLQICRAVHADTPGPFVEDLNEFVNGSAPYAVLHAPDPRLL